MGKVMSDIHHLNRLYVHSIRNYPINQVTELFNLDKEIILALRAIPEEQISKLTDVEQLIICIDDEKI